MRRVTFSALRKVADFDGIRVKINAITTAAFGLTGWHWSGSPLDVHWPALRNLNELLSWEEDRVVQGDWTVACEKKRYQLDRQHEGLSLVQRKEIVRTLRNGRVQVLYRGKPIM